MILHLSLTYNRFCLKFLKFAAWCNINMIIYIFAANCIQQFTFIVISLFPLCYELFAWFLYAVCFFFRSGISTLSSWLVYKKRYNCRWKAKVGNKFYLYFVINWVIWMVFQNYILCHPSTLDSRKTFKHLFKCFILFNYPHFREVFEKIFPFKCV